MRAELRLGDEAQALEGVGADVVICDPPYGARVHRGARSRGWFVALTSHDLIPSWESAYRDAGRYVFAPLPCVVRGSSCRLTGDGPSSVTVFAMVARPRSAAYARWGTLPGFYSVARESGARQGRGKPLALMRGLVGHYSRPGDLVVDPFAGYASTLIAALELGRHSLGAEVDPLVQVEGLRRLAAAQVEVRAA